MKQLMRVRQTRLRLALNAAWSVSHAMVLLTATWAEPKQQRQLVAGTVQPWLTQQVQAEPVVHQGLKVLM
jgi:hypothetical protein